MRSDGEEENGFSDILLRLNKDQRPELISTKTMKNSVSYVDEEDDARSSSSSVTYALQVLSEEEMCFNEHFRPIGLIYSKARQLRMLNFIPVIVRILVSSLPDLNLIVRI